MRLPSIVALAAASFVAACSSASAPASPAPQTDQSASRTIRIGETVTGTIDSSDPTWGGDRRFDAYAFQANEGDRVIIRLTSEDFDPYLVVGTESGGLFDALAQDDDGGDELDSRIRFTAPRTGTYRILAQAYAEYGVGEYVLSLESFTPSAETGTLSVGIPVDGFLSDEDSYDDAEQSFFDEYAFQAEAGRRYSITMRSEAFDSYLVLGTGSGFDFEEISRNDDSGAGYDSRIVFSPETSGAYTVRATSFGGEAAGAYVIEVAETVPAGPLVVTPVALGQTVNGTLSDGDQIAEDGSFFDAYSFTGSQGDRVEIVMRSDALDSYLEVGEPAGANEEFFAEYSDDDSAGDLDARIRITLPRDGEYQIRAISLYPEETGEYTLVVRQNDPAPITTQPIRLGQTVRGTIDDEDPTLDDGSRYEVYTFEGRAGQDVRITLRSDDFDSFLQFGAWDGLEVDATYSDDDSAGGVGGLDSMIEVTLPSNGTYGIMANTVWADETGEFTLTLEEQ
ncbi:MAG TPA: PPC domain-containing protein [Longimicrobiales bacterium]